MGVVAAAAITAAGAVAGAGISAAGAAQNADKQRSMAWANIQANRAFTKDAQRQIDILADEKLTKLGNSSDVISRLGGGIFGDDPQVEKDLRESQANFAALASGNFDGFENLLRSTTQKNLAGSIGSPVGTFTRLSAEDQFNMMQTGLKNSLATSEFFGSQTNNLLGIEFGIMDQRVNAKLQLKANEVAATGQALTGAAQSSGLGTVALGQGISQASSAIGQAYGSYAKSQAASQMQGDLFAATNNIPKAIPVDQYGGSYLNNPLSSGSSNPYTGFSPTAGALPQSSVQSVMGLGPPPDIVFDNNSLPSPEIAPTFSYGDPLWTGYDVRNDLFGGGVLPPKSSF